MDLRTGENARESWWVTNLSKKTITIGDLLLVPAIKPKKRVDLLYYYTREKVGHSTVLVSLVKAGIVSLNKDKIYTNDFPGQITSSNVDEAITPAEENEVTGKVTTASGWIVNTTRYTTTANILVTDHTIFCDTDGGAWTATLPVGVDGQTFRIINCGSNILTIAPNGTDEIMGDNSNYTLRTGDILILIYNTVEGWW